MDTVILLILHMRKWDRRDISNSESRTDNKRQGQMVPDLRGADGGEERTWKLSCCMIKTAKSLVEILLRRLSSQVMHFKW